MKAFVVLLAGSALLIGCAAERIQIRVDSAKNVNEQRSVYLLVRKVEEADYRQESYDEVAARVVHPDDSVVGMAVALPGVPQSFSFAAPEKGRVAVYALFERPKCGAWRVLVPASALPKVELRLSDGRICLLGDAGECVATECVAEAQGKP
ncbi:MAG TPA: hypothetical protein VJV79_38950 [Polyangiaceae bacterium]|nr:hypothetical protein [Polyangiaceae bacterium]